MRFIAIVVFSLAVFSTSRCAHQEPLTVEELEKFSVYRLSPWRNRY